LTAYENHYNYGKITKELTVLLRF